MKFSKNDKIPQNLVKFRYFSGFPYFLAPEGAPRGAQMGPEIGEIRIPWKSEKCKNPTYLLHISKKDPVGSYGL